MKDKVGLLVTILGLLIALAACIAAILVIPEFRLAVGLDEPTPTSIQQLPKIRCVGTNTIADNENGEISESSTCELNLQEHETIAGTTEGFADEMSNSSLSCTVFVIKGPANIRGLKLANANWSYYENLDTEDANNILEAKETELRRQPGVCFQANVNYVVLPAIISVPGLQEDGIKFQIYITGKYSIQIADGAYSPFPFEGMSNKEWRTLIYIYKNQQVIWEERVKAIPPDNPNETYFEPSKTSIIGSIGEWEVTTQDEAERLGKIQTPLVFELQADDFLIFVPLDDMGWYRNPSDNRGEVYLEISLLEK